MKYRNSNHLRLSIILFIFVLIILIVLLCINHKDILRNDRRYSFQEAFQKQTQSNKCISSLCLNNFCYRLIAKPKLEWKSAEKLSDKNMNTGKSKVLVPSGKLIYCVQFSSVQSLSRV